MVLEINEPIKRIKIDKLHVKLLTPTKRSSVVLRSVLCFFNELFVSMVLTSNIFTTVIYKLYLNYY